MTAQKRSSNRNYIDLLDREDGGRGAAERPPASAHSIKDYLRGLVAAMRSTRASARRADRTARAKAR